MANIFIVLMDTTKDRTDCRQMRFFKVPALSDISGYIKCLAVDNGSPLSAIRLFVAPNKKTWTAMSLDYTKRVDWSKAV